MALRNQLPLERIRVFGLAASSLLAHIKFPVIARANRQPRATNDRSNHPKTEGVPLVLTLKWLQTDEWTETNFCKLRIRRKRDMARSRRRNGKCEFSALLFSQRPVSCRSALPMTFIAAP
jgi:hypothetical protein